ncbi:MAG: hypothetical protein H0X24_01820 [Ktedonobacterales bacterium]|nr:hypothetical protein [Ktedonobacterales bacterium]
MPFPYQQRLRRQFHRLDDVVYGMGSIAHVITSGSGDRFDSYASYFPQVEAAEAARREVAITAFADRLLREAHG